MFVMSWEGTTSSTLPDDVEALKSIILGKDTHIAELERQNQFLVEQVTILQKYRFARSSEKWIEEDRKQQWIFDEAEAGFQEKSGESEEVERISYTRKKRKGRRPIPEHLPRTVITHELTEAQRRCPLPDCSQRGQCKKLRPVIGEDYREELEFIPAQIIVKRHVYKKYGQIPCETFEQDEQVPMVIGAEREKRIIPRGIVTASLLSYIAVSKFADGLPLYRQERILARIGIRISRQSMSNWIIQGARACGKYLELFWTRIREGPLINMDETPLQVLHEPGRPAERKSFMWVMVGTGADGKRIVLYAYSQRRNAETAESLLEGYEGALQTDAFSGYRIVAERKRLWHVGCMFHSRRKFYEAHIGAKKQGHAQEGLKYIQRLYRIEEELRKEQLADEEFVDKRRRAAAPVFREFKGWLIKTSLTVPPRSLLGNAITYTLNEYQRLVRYLRYAYLTPDNNVAENGLRPFVVGRKAWLFNNTPLGAHASAGMYSMIETAKANNLDPFHFMYRLFERLPHADTDEKLEKLLPWNITDVPLYKAGTGLN